MRIRSNLPPISRKSGRRALPLWSDFCARGATLLIETWVPTFIRQRFRFRAGRGNRRTRSAAAQHNRHRSLFAFAAGPNVERHSRQEPPKASLGPEGLEPKREPLRTQTL